MSGPRLWCESTSFERFNYMTSPSKSTTKRWNRNLLRIGVAAALTLASVGIVAAPAQAATYDTEPCNESTSGKFGWVATDVETTPTLVQFLSLHVTPGTVGERTETLDRIRTVTTTYNGSTEINASTKFFESLGVKLGFSVQSQKSTTDRETRSMRWAFNTPGYYGLYKATRVVKGIHRRAICRATADGWAWQPILQQVSNHRRPFTTYANLEEGTVSCTDSPPDGSLRALARQQLSC